MMRVDERIVAVVLAAGASSRMGRPKALLDFDGQSCVARVVASCRQAAVETVVLVSSPDGSAVRSEVPGAIEAINERPERGMLSSLQAGLRKLPAEATGFLIYPVDYPVVPADEVRRLLDAFAARAEGQRIFIPSFDHRRGHPVLVEATLAGELLALDVTSSARAVITAHAGEITHVAAADDRVLMDMDTPEDYRRCLERARS
jgi:CTP:molybdopterin cytidylyltransferase MocA